MRWLFSTDPSLIQLVLRWTLAVVMFPHGAQKALGWFGGHGFKGTMAFFGQKFPAPSGFSPSRPSFSARSGSPSGC